MSTYTRSISPGDKIVDSRDVIARLRELEEYRDGAMETLTEHQERITEIEALDGHTLEEADELVRLKGAIWTAEDGTEYAESGDWDEETEREWKALTELQDEAEGYSEDWRHGAQLISDDHFEDYAREFADDIGSYDRDAKWPLNHIDWEAAAAELQQDYTSVEWDGVTYWIR